MIRKLYVLWVHLDKQWECERTQSGDDSGTTRTTCSTYVLFSCSVRATVGVWCSDWSPRCISPLGTIKYAWSFILSYPNISLSKGYSVFFMELGNWGLCGWQVSDKYWHLFKNPSSLLHIPLTASLSDSLLLLWDSRIPRSSSLVLKIPTELPDA